VDVESIACPVSVITDESIRTVQRFFEAKRTQKLGGVMFGPDSSQWPARWFETVSLIEQELDREHSAFKAAESAYISQRNH
jgi:hypothetical protein